MEWTNDPVADAERHAAEGEERASELPVCDYCGKVLYDGYAYDIGGALICDDCLDKHHRVNLEE